MDIKNPPNLQELAAASLILRPGEKLIVADDEEDFALARGDCPCCHTKGALFGPSDEQRQAFAQQFWSRGDSFNHYYLCEHCLVKITMAEDLHTEVLSIEHCGGDWFMTNLFFFCIYGDRLTRYSETPHYALTPWVDSEHTEFLFPEFIEQGEINTQKLMNAASAVFQMLCWVPFGIISDK